MSDREAALAWMLHGIGPDRMRASLIPYRDERLRISNLACLYLDPPHFRVMPSCESIQSRFRMSEADAAKKIIGCKPGADWADFVESHERQIQEWYPRLSRDSSKLLALAELEARKDRLPLAMIAFGVTDSGEEVAILSTHAALRVDLALVRLRDACQLLA
ncbi:MAG TPA: hypothetical protein VFZ48_01855 [Candidatus Saccharimonadales bacterium]